MVEVVENKLSGEEVGYVHSLYNLYAQRGTFQLDEYLGVFQTYTKIKNYLIELKTNEEKKSNEVPVLDLTTEDYRFIFNTLTVCSKRTPTDVQDMKQVVALYEKLAQLISDSS
jgi:aldehyde:ferredoxin oxidoreductase